MEAESFAITPVNYCTLRSCKAVCKNKRVTITGIADFDVAKYDLTAFCAIKIPNAYAPKVLIPMFARNGSGSISRVYVADIWTNGDIMFVINDTLTDSTKSIVFSATYDID